MEMKKGMFGKSMFAGLSLTMGHKEEFDQRDLARILPITSSSY